MSLRPGTRAEVRKKSYKAGVDVDEGRRRREGNLIEIRKSKREDSLIKKRREVLLQAAQQAIGEPPALSPSGIDKKVRLFLLSARGVTLICRGFILEPNIRFYCASFWVDLSEERFRFDLSGNVFFAMINVPVRIIVVCSLLQ